MTIPGGLAPFIGFNETDVHRLCHRRSLNPENMRRYGGYSVGTETPVYCPYSVIHAAFSGKFCDYWNRTETFELLRRSIDLPVADFPSTVIELLNHRPQPLDLSDAVNAFSSLNTVGKVLMLLVHLGYLTYNAGLSTVMIPNEEVRTEFLRACHHSHHTELRKAVDPIL